MRAIPSFVALPVLLATLACSSNGPAFERLEHPPELPGTAVTVTLRDARERVQSGPADVPLLTLGGGHEQPLALDPRLASMLEFTLRRALVAGPHALALEVEVLEAMAGWEAGIASETEKASAHVALVVRGGVPPEVLFRGEGRSWAERTSLDTSAEKVAQILSIAVQGAVLEGLASPACRKALAAPAGASPH